MLPLFFIVTTYTEELVLKKPGLFILADDREQ